MLKCRDLVRVASDYLDGELDWRQRLSVWTHLAICGHCRTFLGNLRATTALMRGHSDNRAREALVRRIDERVAEALARARAEDPP